MDHPAASALIALQCGIHFAMWARRIDLRNVCYNYLDIVERWQLWRCFSSALTHFNFLHLAFNMSALYSLRWMENLLGPAEFLYLVLLLVVSCFALQLLVSEVLVHALSREEYAHTRAVGFSGVIFGLMTVASLWQPDSSLSVFGRFELPITYAPFSSLILTQIMVRRASFAGHAAGIVSGFLYGWGLFAWMDRFSVIVLCVWFIVYCVVGFLRDHPAQFPFVESCRWLATG